MFILCAVVGHMHVEVVGSFQDIAPLFYHVCVKDGVQAVHLGGTWF